MTDTANTGLEQSTTPTPRQAIRESWVNYVGNITYDLTRSAVDFFLEGVLKEMSVYAKTTSEKNDTNLDKFKGFVGSFTNFVRPKTLALSDMIGSSVSYFSKNLVGNLIGQFYSTAKAQSYELDTKNKGWINKAVTAFARENVKYMIAGGLTFAGVGQTILPVAPEFLTTNVGATIASLLTGAGIGLAGNQLLPRMYQFIVSKLPTKTPEQPKTENKDQTPTQEPDPIPTPEFKPTSGQELNSTSDQALKDKEKPTSNEQPQSSPFHVTLRVKSNSELTTEDKESDNEGNNLEQQATLQHQARYTPSADAQRNEIDLNHQPKTPEYRSESDIEQDDEYGEDYRSDSDRNEDGFSAENENDEENSSDIEDSQSSRRRSSSRSNDSSNRSSSNSSDDDSSRSPSPVQKIRYRRIR